jgi:cysteine-rich repeat protein
MSTHSVGKALLLAVALLVRATVAAAEPGPLGPEFPADDRELPGNNWHLSCVDDAGITTSLEREAETCVEDECIPGTELLIQRRDATGTPIGEPLAIADDPVTFTGFRLNCLRSGAMLAQWLDTESHCYLHRALDASGSPIHLPRRTAPNGYSFGKRANITLHKNGEFFAVWDEPVDGTSILLQHFDAHGRASGEVIVVAEHTGGLAGRPKLAIDTSGLGVVVWQSASGDDAPNPVYARFLSASRQPIGDAFVVNTFTYGSANNPAVVPEGGGIFVVLWANLLQGGRVGRRISIVGSVVNTTPPTTTTMPLPEDMPQFGAAQIVDSTLQPQAELTENNIERSDVGAWFLKQADDYVRSTVDDGQNWSQRMPVVDPADGKLAALGSDGEGVWVALYADRNGGGVQYLRSSDKGANWSSARLLPGDVTSVGNCTACNLAGTAAVAGSPTGTWMAAWSYATVGTDPETGEPINRSAVAIARSTGRGNHWGSFADVAVDHGVGNYGFELATDGSGVWVLMWADEDLWFVNSRDDGVNWSEPQRLASNIVCTKCNLHHRYRRLSAAGDGRGNWVAAFASPLLDPYRWGYDADIFVVRSFDAGANWTAPSPVLPDSATDGSRDLFPAVATDRTGRWLVTFTSYRPLKGPEDMDADVLAALSTDNGFSWSRAVAVNEDAAVDAVGDLAPTLAADERGVWMTAWRALTFESEGHIVAERVHVATADAECGNHHLDPAEQCDDGNRDDDDGCDSNCTLSLCGNGIPTEAEECDDSNETDDDFCVAGCKLPACGDGVRAHDEQCDDGNLINTDECTDECVRADCGDGYVQQGVEECDDGNGNSYDGCTNDCNFPFCGDGFRSDTEECDDGNTDNDDWCVGACEDAVCGDGHVNRFAERCDFADPDQVEFCDANCGVPEGCGDADGNGTVTAGDVQRILGNGLGLEVVCPRTVCDVDGTGSISAPDAQRSLALAVGLAVEEECSVGAVDITFFVGSDESLGSLQVNVQYGLTGGFFVGAADSVDCVGLIPGTVITFNNDERVKTLRIGMISLVPFKAPISIARCRFNNPLDAPRPEFTVDVVDAADENFVHQDPVVDYRVHGEYCETSCDESRCGDGSVDAWESCDDGNNSNEDACTNSCVHAFCGDGYVENGVEECDSGKQNGGGGDCSLSCRLGGCGNGRIEDGESCDDGNGSSSDFCLNDCTTAFCGDGFVNPATEQCDPNDSLSEASCEADCHETDGCEDDGSECAIGGSWIIFSVSDAGTSLGALQFNVDYAESGIRFFGRDDGVKCVSLLDGAITSFNDDQDVDTLRTGIISLGGFSTPRDVAACRIEIAPDAPAPEFEITVVDASSSNLNPVFPLPTVNSRLYR